MDRISVQMRRALHDHETSVWVEVIGQSKSQGFVIRTPDMNLPEMFEGHVHLYWRDSNSTTDRASTDPNRCFSRRKNDADFARGLIDTQSIPDGVDEDNLRIPSTEHVQTEGRGELSRETLELGRGEEYGSIYKGVCVLGSRRMMRTRERSAS